MEAYSAQCQESGSNLDWQGSGHAQTVSDESVVVVVAVSVVVAV